MYYDDKQKKTTVNPNSKFVEPGVEFSFMDIARGVGVELRYSSSPAS